MQGKARQGKARQGEAMQAKAKLEMMIHKDDGKIATLRK
jgi:hypothetical protein